jgi:phytoene dehydrogenase-like protein
MAERNVVLIGAGHNGLVTAFYLAKAGFRPLLLERRAVPGGSAVTEEFHPGFRVSNIFHTLGPIHASIARDMGLAGHGLEVLAPSVRLFAPAPDGRHLVLHDDTAATARSIAALSPKDGERYAEFRRVLGRLGAFLSQVLTILPPDIDRPTAGDLWNLLVVGKGLRGLSRKDQFTLFRWGPMAIADLVAEHFETELLRAVIAARGTFGSFLGPWSAGTSTALLLRAASDPHPAGPSAFPRGGIGALTGAMARAAQAAGATIRTGAEVERILVRDGRAAGVVLKGGEEIPARAVISNADPKRTLLGLLDPAHLEPDFAFKMRNYRMPGILAKVNLALTGLPAFRALQGAAGADPRALLAGRIHIGPSIDDLERAFDAAKYGGFAERPWLEGQIPTLLDPSLAPTGRHVMSIHVQYAPYRLKGGDWAGRRDALGETVLKTLAEYAPDLPGMVLGRQVLTPADLETTYGLTGGHPFHGELALDQIFTMRPLLGWARHKTPIRSLYLCGSGTHPGSGLNGISGANAARAILKDLR